MRPLRALVVLGAVAWTLAAACGDDALFAPAPDGGANVDASPRAPPPADASGDAAAAGTVARVYVIGGDTTSRSTAPPAFVFSPRRDVLSFTVSGTAVSQVRAEAPLPIPLTRAAVARVGASIVVAGGSTADGFSGRVFFATPRADGVIDNWKEGAPLPRAVDRPAIAVSGSLVYVFGGEIEAGVATNEAWVARLDGEMLTPFVSTTPLPAPVFHGGGASLGSFVYAVGGAPDDVPRDASAAFSAALAPDGGLGAWTTQPASVALLDPSTSALGDRVLAFPLTYSDEAVAGAVGRTDALGSLTWVRQDAIVGPCCADLDVTHACVVPVGDRVLLVFGRLFINGNLVDLGRVGIVSIDDTGNTTKLGSSEPTDAGVANHGCVVF